MTDKHECLKHMSCPKKIRQKCNDDCPNMLLQRIIEQEHTRRIRLDDRIIGHGLRIIG